MRISDKKTEAMHVAPSEGQWAGRGCPVPEQHKFQQHKPPQKLFLTSMLIPGQKEKKKKTTLQYYREDHNAKMDFILLLSSSTVSLLIFIYTRSLIVLSDPLLASSVCHGHVKHNIISDAALRTQVFS